MSRECRYCGFVAKWASESCWCGALSHPERKPTHPENMKNIWRIWAKAIGDKAGKHNREADIIALVRTLIVLFYIITNIFIIAGVIRHW